MNINGVELKADFLDADFIDVFETALIKMQKRADDAKNRKWPKNSDAMREICAYIDEFFDDAFGAGTAESLFGGKNNVGVHFEALEAVYDERDKVNSVMANVRNKYLQRQAGYQNRQQRRHNK